MKNKSFKRILSIILALVLTLGMLVVPAYAEDDNELEIISSVCVTAVTPTTISVKKINNVYYSLDNTTNWTTDATFAGLYPNTQHKVYYRFGTTGTPKELATVTTRESESRTSRALIDSNAPYTLDYTGYASSFELKNDLSYRLYLKASKFTGYSNFRILVEHQTYDSTTQSYSWVSSVIKPIDGLHEYAGAERYVFIYPNLASFQINDKINVTLYAEKDGKTYIAPICQTSLVDTAMSLFPTADAALSKVLADFLNYGAASQTFFSYNTAKLANASMGAYASYATSTNPTLVDVTKTIYKPDVRSASILQPSISVDTKIALLFPTTFSAGVDPSKVVMKIEYDSPTLGKQSQQYKFNSVKGCFIVDGIATFDFATPFTLTIYQGSTAISSSLRYSVESRAATMISGDPSLADILYALMKFSHSAQAYFS